MNKDFNNINDEGLSQIDEGNKVISEHNNSKIANMHSHLSDVKKYDSHTIYVYSENATGKEVFDLINKIRSDIEHNLEIKLKPQIRTNIIKKYLSDGEYENTGKGYVWVSDEILYYFLIGEKEKILERMKKTPVVVRSSNTSDPKNITSWADMVDSDEEPEKDIKPKINSELLSIFNPNFGNPQKIFFSKAYSSGVPDKYKKNVICCPNYSEDLNTEDFKKIFSIFNTGNYLYPKISLYKDIAFITFDPETDDAEFSLYLTKKTIYTKNKNKYNLSFNYCFKKNKN